MSGLLSTWPTLPPGIALRHRRTPPFPLGQAGALFTAQGRGGLHLGLVALGVGPGDEVLVPAYHHGSEVEAVLGAGARAVFYGGTPRLEPDSDELEQLRTAATRALHLTHFLGFPQDCARWRRWCDERELLLIEDAAPAWLAQCGGHPVGTYGDLAMFCLYKTVGVPDGAITVCRAPLEGSAKGPVGWTGALKRTAAWAAQRLSPARRLAFRGAGRRFEPARAFALGEPARPAARTTRSLVGRFDHHEVRERRRRHYEQLLEALGDRVAAPFDSLPAGAVPWVFPVEAEDKAGLLSHLRSDGVNPLDYWSVPHPALEAARWPAIARRRARTIGLPVHQGLGARDVARIAELVAAGPA